MQHRQELLVRSSCRSHWRGSLSITTLHACAKSYIQHSALLGHPQYQSGCCYLQYHSQYTFLSLCQFFSRENRQNMKILEVRHFHNYDTVYRNGHKWLLGTQSINTESLFKNIPNDNNMFLTNHTANFDMLFHVMGFTCLMVSEMQFIL